MSDDVKRIAPVRSRGGVWVRIGDEEYKIAALGLDAIQDLQERMVLLQSIHGLPTREQMTAVYEIIHSALRRNYPDLPLEEVREMVDIRNFNAVLNAALDVSGFVRVKPGEAAGEATASTGTGTTSTSP